MKLNERLSRSSKLVLFSPIETFSNFLAWLMKSLNRFHTLTNIFSKNVLLLICLFYKEYLIFLRRIFWYPFWFILTIFFCSTKTTNVFWFTQKKVKIKKTNLKKLLNSVRRIWTFYPNKCPSFTLNIIFVASLWIGL